MFRQRFRHWILPVALGMSCVGFLLPARMVGEKAPKAANLSLRNMNEKTISLHDLRGHIVVLNFWATWCGPCKAEMPMLVQADEQYQQKGVAFLGASLDDAKSQKNIPAFLNQYHVSYIILTGASADNLAKLKMGIAVPATAFIDEKGAIRFRILGQMRPRELQERIDWLLRESSNGKSDVAGPAPPALVTHLEKK